MRLALLFLVLHVPALRALLKFTPPRLAWVIPLYFVFQFAFLYLLTRRETREAPRLRPFHNPVFVIALIAALAIVNFFLYSYADGLAASGRGSDQDNAVIQAVTRLFSGMDPYGAPTYLGNPISTGPGLLLLAAPFVFAQAWFLTGPLTLLLMAFLIRRETGPGPYALLYTAIFMSSLAAWEAMAAGSDLPFAGALLCGGLLLLRAHHDRGGVKAWAAALLFILAATSRVIFLYLIPFALVLLYKRDKKEAARFFIAALIALALLYGPFLFAGGTHSPLHIIGKGMVYPTWLLIAGVVCSAAAGLLIMWRAEDTSHGWMGALLTAAGVPLLFIALGDVLKHGMNFSVSEAPTYLGLLAPIACAWFTLGLSRE